VVVSDGHEDANRKYGSYRLTQLLSVHAGLARGSEKS